MKSYKGILSYYPELGESKPQAEIELQPSHIANRYRIATPLDLSGRGIKYYDTYTASNCTTEAKYGWHVYYVTESALKQLARKYTIAKEVLLN